MEFNKYFDHTILKATASSKEVIEVCNEAKRLNVASVCVNSCYTKLVASELEGTGISTCVVVGFPLGAMSTKAKAFEAACAIEDGADEVDMVINIGMLKDGNLEGVKEDIKACKDACGDKILKVIIETCYLTDEEKRYACEASIKAGADFVKTSTGFGTSGATVSDVVLMKKIVGSKVKIKASGGIRDYDTADAMIRAGASRLGTSRTAEIIACNN